MKIGNRNNRFTRSTPNCMLTARVIPTCRRREKGAVNVVLEPNSFPDVLCTCRYLFRTSTPEVTHFKQGQFCQEPGETGSKVPLRARQIMPPNRFSYQSITESRRRFSQSSTGPLGIPYALQSLQSTYIAPPTLSPTP